MFDNIARVSIPYLVACGLPLGGPSCYRDGAIVLEAGILPLDTAELDCVNLLVKILMVGNGWRVPVGHERGGPQFEKLVNPSLRKFSIGEHEFSEFIASV